MNTDLLVTEILYLDSGLFLKILADAMGLGKTVMTISLLLSNSERVGSPCSQLMSLSSGECMEISKSTDASPDPPKKVAKLQGFDKLKRQENILMDGGNLIVCPMTLISQWKVYAYEAFPIYVRNLITFMSNKGDVLFCF